MMNEKSGNVAIIVLTVVVAILPRAAFAPRRGKKLRPGIGNRRPGPGGLSRWGCEFAKRLLEVPGRKSHWDQIQSGLLPRSR